MAKVTMPQLGESVAEGTIGRWLKKPGDRVEKYEPLVEVITDKVNAEVPSPFAGTLTAILVEEGAMVPNDTPIAEIETAEIGGDAASELAPAVRVNGIAPAYVNSNWECSFGDIDAAARATVPLGRVGQTTDYAEVIVYLCAGAAYITGEVVPVTGGTRI